MKPLPKKLATMIPTIESDRAFNFLVTHLVIYLHWFIVISYRNSYMNQVDYC